MKVSKLIEQLQAIEDKDVEVRVYDSTFDVEFSIDSLDVGNTVAVMFESDYAIRTDKSL